MTYNTPPSLPSQDHLAVPCFPGCPWHDWPPCCDSATRWYVISLPVIAATTDDVRKPQSAVPQSPLASTTHPSLHPERMRLFLPIGETVSEPVGCDQVTNPLLQPGRHRHHPLFTPGSPQPPAPSAQPPPLSHTTRPHPSCKQALARLHPSPRDVTSSTSASGRTSTESTHTDASSACAASHPLTYASPARGPLAQSPHAANAISARSM